jgi:hypothetical protein
MFQSESIPLEESPGVFAKEIRASMHLPEGIFAQEFGSMRAGFGEMH